MADTQKAQRRAQRLMQTMTKGHGATMAKVGQVWAFPSLLALSVGAFITLGGEGLLPGGVATFGRIAATIVLLISGVLALEIALFSIGDAIARRRPTARMAWDILLVLVVGPLETWTFYLLITSQPVTGPIALMRAAEAIMAAAYLSTLIIRPPTDRDFVRVIGARGAERAMEKLEMIPLDEVGMGRLYRIQAVANDDTLTWSQRAEKLVTVMEELAPGEQERAQQQRIAALEALTETAQRQIAEANEQANASATQRTLDALFALVTTGALPAWVIEERPDLAGFSLDTLAAGAARGRGGKAAAGGLSALPSGLATRAPSSRADARRAFLFAQGIEPTPAPEGKNGARRGVWLRASDVTALMAEGRSLASETPQTLVRRLGEGATVGRNLVAPFEPVMRELAERHVLSDAAAAWWREQQIGQTQGVALAPDNGADTGEDSGEHPAVIAFPQRA